MLQRSNKHDAHYSSKRMQAGERIETTEFQLCGHHWALWVCPGGMTEEHGDYVSVFLVRFHPSNRWLTGLASTDFRGCVTS